MKKPQPEPKLFPPIGLSRDVILLVVFLLFGAFLLTAIVVGFLTIGGNNPVAPFVTPTPLPSTVTPSVTVTLEPLPTTLTPFPSSTQAATITLMSTSTLGSVPSFTPVMTDTPVGTSVATRTKTHTPTRTRTPTGTKTFTVTAIIPTSTRTRTLTPKPAMTTGVTRTRTVTLSPAVTETLQLSNTPAAACVGSAPSGLAASDDTWIESENPATTHAGDASLFTHTDNGGNQRILLKFDTTALAGSSVNSATLYIHIESTDPGVSVQVHRLTSAWNEAEATWDDAMSAQPWSTPGGDYNNTAIASFAPPVPADCFVHVDISSLVQGWFDGSISNRGLILIASGSGSLQTLYTSKENGSGKGPVLSVTMNP